MQHQQLQKAIQENDHHKVHEILTATKAKTPTPPQTPASTPLLASEPILSQYGALSNIDLTHIENPRNLLALAEEAEELAAENAGTYGNLGTIFRTFAGLAFIGYGGFQLAINMGYIHNPDNPQQTDIANSTVNGTTAATALGLGARQLYLAFTKRDATLAAKNAAIITHLVKNPGADSPTT
jgi:hypothetical protein